MPHRGDEALEGPAEARRVGGLEAHFYGVEGVADWDGGLAVDIIFFLFLLP